MTEHKGWNSRGYLPHLDAAGSIQHVIFRLQGSLPASVIERLKSNGDAHDFRLAVDDELDRGSGPTLLADEGFATIVSDALSTFDGQRYQLLAWCVMPNHVHVLIKQFEAWPLGEIIKSWKTYTARVINRRLGKKGSFWAADYFDRYVRDDDQLTGVVRYIEANPVKAGLCPSPEAWPFSSASKDPASTSADLEVRAPYPDRGRPRPQGPASTSADLEVRAPYPDRGRPRPPRPGSTSADLEVRAPFPPHR